MLSVLLLSCLTAFSFAFGQGEDAERQRLLRGSITEERAWWDLQHYRLAVEVFPHEKKLSGSNEITFTALKPGNRLQVDLQPPLEVTRVTSAEQELAFERQGKVVWVDLPQEVTAGEQYTIRVEYAGQPVVSRNPPWSGGLSWRKDSTGNDFITTSCQGIGASIWWPCKDHGYDEPDRGMDILITVPNRLTAVSNGRLVNATEQGDSQTKTFHWRVTHPINNYCVNMNIGNYVHFSETYEGEAGELDLDYWVLEDDRERAARQFLQVPQTIEAFEYWFGPYPFYEDSYKLVQVPYLGMEHQSSVTYGNGFENGYRGRDRSGTGVGLKFDFIIVHESAHEWFGNNISMRDVADMWIHESFANYSESLFVEYFFTRQEAQDYVIGCRRLIRNDRPIIGTYDRNQPGSGDMYEKGGNMLHTIRQVIDNDIKWRRMLRGLNQEFRHQTVTTQQVEKYLSQAAGVDLSKLFEQYLRTTKIPKLVYSIEDDQLTYHFENVVADFSLPLKVRLDKQHLKLTATTDKQTFQADGPIGCFQVDRNVFIDIERR